MAGSEAPDLEKLANLCTELQEGIKATAARLASLEAELETANEALDTAQSENEMLENQVADQEAKVQMARDKMRAWAALAKVLRLSPLQLFLIGVAVDPEAAAERELCRSLKDFQ